MTIIFQESVIPKFFQSHHVQLGEDLSCCFAVRLTSGKQEHSDQTGDTQNG